MQDGLNKEGIDISAKNCGELWDNETWDMQDMFVFVGCPQRMHLQ